MLPGPALPRVYLGTMTFGWNQVSAPVDEVVALAMLNTFVACGGKHIDTARIYAGGKGEPLVGKVARVVNDSLEGEEKGAALVIGSKAAPSGAGQPMGGLSADNIRMQCLKSLEELGIDCLGEYFLHQPDTETSLLETLKAAHELVKEGKITRLGLSNYHATEVARAFQLCDEHGLTRPTVYQGLYNPLNRAVEEELLPLLRQHGCSFVAYNPLAAGLLTGVHKPGGEVPAGRFKDNPNYLPRFYTDSCFTALQKIREVCDATGVPLVDATFRWLLRHSALGEGDGVLLGASSLEQLETNLAACINDDALPPAVLEALDRAWETASEGAFAYWRSYSADMPGRDELDQGASYDPSKTSPKK